MPEKTAAQKKAQKTYMGKFARIEVRVTLENRDTIQTHAAAHGESVNGFIGRAISEAMERDGTVAGQSPRPGEVSLPPDVLETAQRAAETARETLEEFMRRAIHNQVERDQSVQAGGSVQ